MDEDKILSLIDEVKINTNTFIENELYKNNIKDINLIEFNTLLYLYKNNNIVSVKRLSNYLQKPKSTISDTIKSLIKKEYINKSKSNTDKRQYYIESTAKFESFNEIIIKIHKKLLNKVFNNFESIEKEIAIQIFEKIIDNFN